MVLNGSPMFARVTSLWPFSVFALLCFPPAFRKRRPAADAPFVGKDAEAPGAHSQTHAHAYTHTSVNTRAWCAPSSPHRTNKKKGEEKSNFTSVAAGQQQHFQRFSSISIRRNRV
uniref:Putative secreted protein n=1 Tax=Anopheles triannulatus TaxID=58253 RepID=A0A2M4B3U0_9DIPT